MKRNTNIFMAAIIAALSGLFAVQALQETSARAAVVMDVNSNRILYSKNMDEKLAMASTTKIMTTLVAIESGRLDEKVTISKRASHM